MYTCVGINIYEKKNKKLLLTPVKIKRYFTDTYNARDCAESIPYTDKNRRQENILQTIKLQNPHRIKTAKNAGIEKRQITEQRLSNGIIGLNANQIARKKCIHIHIYITRTHTLLMVFLADFVNIGHFFFAQCNNRKKRDFWQ